MDRLILVEHIVNSLNMPVIALRIFLLLVKEVKPNKAVCAVMEYGQDMTLLYSTLGGLGIAIFR